MVIFGHHVGSSELSADCSDKDWVLFVPTKNFRTSNLFSPYTRTQPAHIHRNTPMHTRIHLNTPTHACDHLHTCTHPHTLANSPNIPAHALNLMNRMKSYINRPNTKKARRRRKKKEQESAEAFQWTNNLSENKLNYFIVICCPPIVILQHCDCD